MKDIGEKIFDLRSQKEVSQEKLAQALKVTRITISRWENNAVIPTIENIKNLCAFFGVELNLFLSDEEIATMKCEYDNSIAVAQIEAEKEPKLKTLKILATVAGIVLLALCVAVCGIVACVSIVPVQGGRYVEVIDRVNYKGIIFLAISLLAASMLITVSVIIIKNHCKPKNKANCNTVAANCNTDVTDKKN